MSDKHKSGLGPLSDEEIEYKKKIDEILGPIEDVTFDDLFESARQKSEQYNLDLQAKAKTKEELTVGLECTVLNVNGYQGSTSFTPSDLPIGPYSGVSSHKTGDVYKLELLVDSNSPVQKLIFRGCWPLEAGDTIRAYILKGKEEAEKLSFGPSCYDPLHQGPRTHLVEREYQPVEQPSKIEKLRDGKVVATYHNK